MSKPNFKPLGGRILVRRVEADTTSKGGIMIPEAVRQDTPDVTIVTLGEPTRDRHGQPIPFEVKEGQIARLATYAGFSVTLDDVDYLVVREEDLLYVRAGEEPARTKRKR